MTIAELIEELQKYPSHYNFRVIQVDEEEDYYEREFSIAQGNFPFYEGTAAPQSIVSLLIRD